MGEETAKKWVVISSLGVLGIWWYRRFREGPQAVLATPQFITQWGTVFFVLAVITEAAPAFGGAFSMLVLVGDLLGNAMPKHGGGLLADLTAQNKGAPAAGGSLFSTVGASTVTPASVASTVTPPTTPHTTFTSPFSPIATPVKSPLAP